MLFTSPFTITVSGDTATVAIDGQLLVGNRQDLKQKIIDLIAAGVRRFAFDCARCGYIDASGLGVLVSIRKKIHDAGGTLFIDNLDDDLTTLFQLTRLDMIFTLRYTVPQP